jgi:hypothetical protein
MAKNTHHHTKHTKKSSVRHTRAIQRARSKRPVAAPPDEQIEARLSALVQPAIASQTAEVQRLGLRSRLLPLSVMVALVISMIWRQLGAGGSEAARLLATEGLLWSGIITVTQQAISLRLRVLPAALFLGVLQALLPVLPARAQARQRPLPRAVAWAQDTFTAVLAVDGSTLDAVLRQVGLLRDAATPPLAGRMLALLDVASRLPRQVWYEADATAHDQRFWPQISAAVPRGALLLFDLGFTNFARFAELARAQVTWLTRAKSNRKFEVHRVLCRTAHVQDLLVWIGDDAVRQQVRLIKVCYEGEWYSYLTSELDPARLPVAYAVALYWQRWRIEEAFHLVKRLLGLAYFWTGAQNGIELQVWATWLVYGILIDLSDAVAAALNRPLADISLEMVYRGLPYFAQAYRQGTAHDPVAYLVAHAKLLGIIKRPRRLDPLPALLDLTTRQRLNL